MTNESEPVEPFTAAYARGQEVLGVTYIPILPAAATAAGIGRPLAMSAAAWQVFVTGDGTGPARLNVVLSALAHAIEEARPDQGLFVLPPGELPAGQRPHGADRLIACTDNGTSDLLILMLPQEM
ncbi:hypothetical protein ACIQVR_37920 [Streptomyces xanthochromogenes]|uniref:hypothetical protein n=1 Tax=Streptomyces xanthochromogenes TaxID=67384 RepID=UPI0037FAD7E9